MTRILAEQTLESQTLDQLSIDTLRLLAVDEVEKANSGHPGAPLGCAPIAYLLFHKLMKHNPKHSKWEDRDRFVLSNGHASALLYGTLFLAGYNVTLDDLKGFRQWGSRTPGHPEYGHTDGVEVTTGPLGQGIAMAVGMAIAEKHLAAIYNKPGFEVVNHHTFALLGDGDLMEGVSHEAASLAGTLALGKLIFIYDDNLISLDGPTELSYTEDALERFEAYHWHVQRVKDGNDLEAIEAAIEAAKAETARPSIIAVRTVIGYGSPKAGTNKVHGEAMGPRPRLATKKFFGFPEDQSFYVPTGGAENWRKAIDRGAKLEAEWKRAVRRLSFGQSGTGGGVRAHPEGRAQGRVGEGDSELCEGQAGGYAQRGRRGDECNCRRGAGAVWRGRGPDLFDEDDLQAGGELPRGPGGRNVYFGVREFGMCAAVNGMAAHGGLIPFGSTFFVFSDYAKPAIRLAALMKVHSLFVFTHDSIALGEDGPTHQPIEQLMALRAVPQLTDFRPADANETAAAWRLALERKGRASLRSAGRIFR
jgi:transketolase